MGTRGIIEILDERNNVLVTLYNHWDSYPSALGVDLVNFLMEKKIVNGIPAGADKMTIANGWGCLAAQIVHRLKQPRTNYEGKPDRSSVYIEPLGTRDMGEEYIYTIYPNPHDSAEICMKIQTGAMTMFGLPGTKQKNMPLIFQGPIQTFDLKKIEVRDERAHEEGIPNDFIEQQKDTIEESVQAIKDVKEVNDPHFPETIRRNED